MKVARSFWLGLGSGLILSAMLAMLFSPSPSPSDPQSSVNLQTPPPQTEETKESELTPPVQSPKPVPQESLSQGTQGSVQIERDFVIPKGASAEGIADLLFAQEFIKDKEAFLVRARQMGAERRFRAGTFKLSVGLTEEEVVNRLLK